VRYLQLQRENVQFNEQNMWPPNSPDLNPVDYYAIWGALQQMVYHRQSFVSVDELKRTIVEAWQQLPQSFIGIVVWSDCCSATERRTHLTHVQLTCKVLILCPCFVVVSCMYVLSGYLMK